MSLEQRERDLYGIEKFTWKKVCRIIIPQDSFEGFQSRVKSILKDLVQKNGNQRKFEEESDFLNLRIQSSLTEISIERLGENLPFERRETLIEYFKKNGLQVVENEAA